ncbi:hypothetical protein F477_02434 [Pseudomonas sp. URIL14HWK12:I3]|uniref:antitoxin Xre-like helix-turn-helix domain-containing protein n=1 Tax=Pseudomonas TaxID=286 RepID=UPI000DAC9F68|nr:MULTISPECIES: antitoxin Xre-like helix-turn-helix domain-containing protein [unclassified Pseudomonas]PZW48230.1 hypothetical protein F478_04051 [Pseudomonas sp. URIL14HWK12:I2]PZW56727.1 hypothetical protein F477_02434 [Pseudomonas sp. URIL14HWK12:I3]
MAGSKLSLTHAQATTGLRAALRIIEAWRATASQACRILRISAATRHRVIHERTAVVRLDRDQQQRISLVLNIHASLRSVFTNQDNVQGFAGMLNDNPLFEGRTPLEVMAQGNLISLYETYLRIDQLKRAS